MAGWSCMLHAYSLTRHCSCRSWLTCYFRSRVVFCVRATESWWTTNCSTLPLTRHSSVCRTSANCEWHSVFRSTVYHSRLVIRNSCPRQNFNVVKLVSRHVIVFSQGPLWGSEITYLPLPTASIYCSIYMEALGERAGARSRPPCIKCNN